MHTDRSLRCKRLHTMKWRFNVIARVNEAYSLSRAQKSRPDHRSQQDKLQGARMCRGLRKEVLRYVSNLWNNGFIISHRANGCWQPNNDARAKGSIDRASKQTWMEHDGGRRSGRGMERDPYKRYCHKTALLRSHCTSAVTTPAISYCTCWRCASLLVSDVASVHQTKRRMRESRITQTQAGIQYTALMRLLVGPEEQNVISSNVIVYFYEVVVDHSN